MGNGPKQDECNDSRDTQPGTTRAVTFCIVPWELADELHEPLRQLFSDDPAVEVVVERRRSERRAANRRSRPAKRDVDRRRIRSRRGRRVAERRARATEVPPPRALPKELLPHASALRFVRRIEPGDERREDIDTSRAVIRFQSGDPHAFEVIYLRYFDRVYRYLRLTLRDPHEAEDGAQEVLTRVLEALPRYELRAEKPFRAWLFRIARNHAMDILTRRSRADLEAPAELERRRGVEPDERELRALAWVSDDELGMLVERLPLAQRQAVVLHTVLGLSTREVAAIIGRNPEAVRQLRSRGLRFLRARLAAMGVSPPGKQRHPMTNVRPLGPVLRARQKRLRRSA